MLAAAAQLKPLQFAKPPRLAPEPLGCLVGGGGGGGGGGGEGGRGGQRAPPPGPPPSKAPAP